MPSPAKTSPTPSQLSAQTRLSPCQQRVAQAKATHCSPQTPVQQAKPVSAAPPVYRPQPTPRVLQAKTAVSHPLSRQAGSAAPQSRPTRAMVVAPKPNATAAAHRPQTSHGVAQAKAKAIQPKAIDRVRPQTISAAQPRAVKQGVLRPSASSVVQAKVYPNLHPGAVESVNPNEVFKLHSFADQFRLRKANNHGVYVPNQQYNFVRTREGEMLLHNRYRHPSIAEGQQVLYAGEVFFNNGKLKWWSNGSGHYQPDVEDATQANLPMDYFYSYQQIIKGEHMRKKE